MSDDKHSISIDGNLYREIKDYCKVNALSISKFVGELLRQQFMIEKYGDTPFSSPASFVRPDSQSLSKKDETDEGVVGEKEFTSSETVNQMNGITVQETTIIPEIIETTCQNETVTTGTKVEETETVTIKPRKRRLS